MLLTGRRKFIIASASARSDLSLGPKAAAPDSRTREGRQGNLLTARCRFRLREVLPLLISQDCRRAGYWSPCWRSRHLRNFSTLVQGRRLKGRAIRGREDGKVLHRLRRGPEVDAADFCRCGRRTGVVRAEQILQPDM